MVVLIIKGPSNKEVNYCRFETTPSPPLPPKKHIQKIIAVDFDGTIVKSRFPEIGPLKEDIANRIREEKRKGNIIILWTCRGGKELTEAVSFLKENNIPFDYVNENPLNPYGDTTRKLFADEYWDDKAVRVL